MTFIKYRQLFKDALRKNLNLRTALGFAISGILLWLTFHQSGLKLRDLELKGKQGLYFAGAGAVFIFALWVQSVRMKLMWLNGKNKFREIDTFNGIIIGNFYNCLLPGNLGEAMRALHFGRKHRVPFSRSLASIVTQKWIDAQMFALFALILFSAKLFTPHYLSYSIAGIAGAVLALWVIYIAMRRYERMEKFIWLAVLRLKKAGRFLFRLYRHVTNHLDNLRKRRFLALYYALGIVLNALDTIQYLFLLNAAGITAPVNGLYTAFLAAASMMIIAVVPSAPGNIGVAHFGIYSALVLSAAQHGIAPDAAQLQSYATFAVYLHLAYFVPEVLLGALFVVKERRWIF